MSGLLWRSLILLGVLLLIAAIWFVMHKKRTRSWAPRTQRMTQSDLVVAPHPLLLIVFTSRFCVACKEVLRTATAVAPEIPLLQIPLHENPQAAARYGLVETPTLFLVDEQRRIRYTALGPVDEEELWLYVREAWDSSSLVREVTATRRARRQ